MNTYVITIILLCNGFLCLSQIRTTTATTTFNGFHCDGKPGICDIDNNDNRSQANTALVLNQNNTLTFTLERQKFSETEQKRIVGVNPSDIANNRHYYFNVPHSYALPNSINQVLHTSSSQLVLAKGSYLIHITEDFYTITFTLN